MLSSSFLRLPQLQVEVALAARYYKCQWYHWHCDKDCQLQVHVDWVSISESPSQSQLTVAESNLVLE